MFIENAWIILLLWEKIHIISCVSRYRNCTLFFSTIMLVYGEFVLQKCKMFKAFKCSNDLKHNIQKIYYVVAASGARQAAWQINNTSSIETNFMRDELTKTLLAFSKVIPVHVLNWNLYNFDSSISDITQFALKITPLNNWSNKMNIVELSKLPCRAELINPDADWSRQQYLHLMREPMGEILFYYNHDWLWCSTHSIC